MTHRVFLVEDHPITREGIRSLIRSAPDLEVAAAREALGFAENLGIPFSEPADYFGWAVAVDGDTAVVGAYYDDDLGGSAFLDLGRGAFGFLTIYNCFLTICK